MERSADISEMSDGYLSPEENTESINSEIFGAPESFGEDPRSERHRKRSLLTRLDEHSELGPSAPLINSGSSSRARPVARRSLSRELYDNCDRSSSSRPVARRSVSRELFDVQFTPSSGRGASMSKADEFDALRASMRARERSMSREFDAFNDAFSPTSGLTSSLLSAPKMNRSLSLNRPHVTSGVGQNWDLTPTGRDFAGSPLTISSSNSSNNPSRPPLSSQGRSITQNDFLGPRSSGGGAAGLGTSGTRNLRSKGDDDIFLGSSGRFGSGSRQQYNNSSSLEDRGRSDWRRISVPERGKDFKSLPRKYNR